MINYRKIHYIKEMKKEVVSEFAILAQKWSKFAPRKEVDLSVFANYPAVYSGEVSRGMSVAVACDM